jgi:hypothetical protein
MLYGTDPGPPQTRSTFWMFSGIPCASMYTPMMVAPWGGGGGEVLNIIRVNRWYWKKPR